MASRIFARIRNLVGPTAAPSSRSAAKERLQIMIAHQRGSEALAGVDMAKLQSDVLQCVSQYLQVNGQGPVQVSVKQDGTLSIFEMQVPLESPAAQRLGATQV